MGAWVGSKRQALYHTHHLCVSIYIRYMCLCVCVYPSTSLCCYVPMNICNPMNVCSCVTGIAELRGGRRDEVMEMSLILTKYSGGKGGVPCLGNGPSCVRK